MDALAAEGVLFLLFATSFALSCANANVSKTLIVDGKLSSK
jgi:hypothetical protein